jgi:hypothetical protein
MMSTELPDEPFLTAHQSVDFLNNELGIPTSNSSFSKETMPSRATGPVPIAYWGKRPLWTPSGLRAWAAARLRSVRLEPTAAPEAASKFPTSKRLLTPGPTPKRMPEMNRPGAVTRPQPRPSAEQP